jgi:hypothetical protein
MPQSAISRDADGGGIPEAFRGTPRPPMADETQREARVPGTFNFSFGMGDQASHGLYSIRALVLMLLAAALLIGVLFWLR